MVRKGQARPQYQFSPCAASRRSTRVDAASGQNCFTASTSSLVAGFSLPQPRGLASAAQFDGLGRLGAVQTRSARRRRVRGSDFVRVHFGLADKGDAFLDDELGGANVAEDFGLGLDLDFIFGVDVAVDFAAND